jgi:ligand-binding sensor domain-containing protein
MKFCSYLTTNLPSRIPLFILLIREMKKGPLHILLVLQVVTGLYISAQTGSHNFHKIGLQDGLHDGTVRCIGQDKYGYIWIGTVGAVNRFDGKTIKYYTNIPGDSSSPYFSQPRAIHSDATGRLWIGYETGLTEFDFVKNCFKRIAAFKDTYIQKIESSGDSVLFIATTRGFYKYNFKSGKIFNYSASASSGHSAFVKNGFGDIAVFNDSLFIASNKGVILFSIKYNDAVLVSLPVVKNEPIRKISVDKKRNTWVSTFGDVKLVKLSPDFKQTTVYDRFLTIQPNTQLLSVMGILTDGKNRVWVATATDGLLQYDEANDSFIKHLHNNQLATSPSGNNYRALFEDRDGTIWLGCDIRGVNYFVPDKYFFKTLFAFPDRLDENDREVARAVTEDKYGNIWMGNHNGLSKYILSTGEYKIWRNENGKPPVLYSNIIRSLYCDDENNIWIGTGGGVNRYNSLTQKMNFISTNDLPGSFYNSINGDRSGNIWFCTNDTAAVYWYDTKEKIFSNIFHHPQLKQFAGKSTASYAFEDSRHRLWLSISRRGVAMLDKKTGQTKHYLVDETGGQSIIGNQVIDIDEDKKGIIWISTINGITGIDTDKNSFISFNSKNGLAGNWASPMVIDDEDRVWVGVNGGLTMLDKDRKLLTIFTMNDGLPSAGFTEHAGLKLRNGDIIFPSNNGYIWFSPSDFKNESEATRFYISGYSIFSRELISLNAEDNNPVLKLNADENTFTFNLVALNYTKPGQTWFAYKLDGFEKDWHYTKDPAAVYTNVPGGNYKFLYKAAAGNYNWEKVTEKILQINLATKFYKTVWFRLLLVAVIAALLFGIYSIRLRNQKRIFTLETKAQQLEKEKTVVMYESLKQQLNPHFLFNSLTSLSGLIESDQQLAGNFLKQMSKIYRYILKSRDSELVSLKEEAEFVQVYINLQKTRFKTGLQVNINIAEDDFSKKIPPVTLQNMVENAIKHNIIDADSPLVIDMYTEGDYLVVKNNLQKKHVVETSNRQGLANLESLYCYLSIKPLIIEEAEREFTIKLPLI